MNWRARGDERGYTLSEVCIAVVILTFAITAAIGALASAIVVSRQHRDVVTSDSIVRQYAEQLIAAPYHDCATGAYYLTNNPPPNITNYTVAITSIAYGSTDNPPVFSGTCATDNGTQLIRIQAQRSGGLGMQTLQIVKRKP